MSPENVFTLAQKITGVPSFYVRISINLSRQHFKLREYLLFFSRAFREKAVLHQAPFHEEGAEERMLAQNVNRIATFRLRFL